jgi:hypothetical protein
MRRHLPLTLALALVLATPVQAAEDTIRKGFNVAQGGTLRLDGAVGDIKVVTGGTGVAIEVIRKASGRKGAERLREHRIEFKQSGNDVIIDSDYPSPYKANRTMTRCAGGLGAADRSSSYVARVGGFG